MYTIFIMYEQSISQQKPDSFYDVQITILRAKLFFQETTNYAGTDQFHDAQNTTNFTAAMTLFSNVKNLIFRTKG